MKKRIPFLLLGMVSSSALLHAAQNPPWRMIYDNDTTNILNCVSPFNEGRSQSKKDNQLTDEKIRASVREAVVPGMDAQLIQPCTSWVPWWPSKIVPLAEHEQWFRERYGTEPDLAEHRYLLAGGDIVGVFIDECHKNNVAALVSFRCNDGHHQERSWDEKVPGGVAHCINRFYVEHPQYRIAPLPSRAIKDRVHNWLVPEARAHKERLLAEVIEVYPTLDGIELDFLRHPYYFPDDTPMAARVEVMCDFIRKARARLDEVAAKTSGKHRYLGVRVPVNEAEWRDVGLEPSAWRKAGVDYFNISPSYNMTQQTGVAALRKDAPDAKIYLELTHTTQTWKFGASGYDGHCWRRSTREMFINTARQAYARGADGVSFFNFVYYRNHGAPPKERGPFDEPPFDYLPALTDKDKISRADGYFYLKAEHELFPKPGYKREYKMNIVPAAGNGAATLRIQMLTDRESRSSELDKPDTPDRGAWAVTLNGKPLAAAKSLATAYPFPTPFKAGFGHPQQYLSFAIPAGLLKDGDNIITIDSEKAPPLRLRWIEILQPATPGAR
ncbi:hypothetical protein OH491_11785 [Termitidicoccus mucosus]|uniref:Glycosyl hydrolase-like 10 domain-containing protein n=1 Tax=Termitidicoccus mucosus TaxID=1184151 RepID=A0A178IHS5_9BACT|nr:hypothetical protein AW736_15595 [Opitutaceae bacterium TSB47]